MPHIPRRLPWKQFSEPDARAEYLVVLTYLPVCRLLWLPRFLADMRKIRRQLEARPACSRVAASAQIRSPRFSSEQR